MVFLRYLSSIPAFVVCDELDDLLLFTLGTASGHCSSRSVGVAISLNACVTWDPAYFKVNADALETLGSSDDPASNNITFKLLLSVASIPEFLLFGECSLTICEYDYC